MKLENRSFLFNNQAYIIFLDWFKFVIIYFLYRTNYIFDKIEIWEII